MRQSTAARKQATVAAPPHPSLGSLSLDIPGDAEVHYVSARDDVLLLRVNAPGRAARVDLAVFMPDAKSNKAAVGAFFEADANLSAVLAALGAASVLHLDLDAVRVLARLGDPTVDRPLAVIAETSRGSAMPEARLSVLRDALSAWAAAAAAERSEAVSAPPPPPAPAAAVAEARPVPAPPGPARATAAPPRPSRTAPLPSPVPAPAGPLAVTPGGEGASRMVELSRGDAAVTVALSEVPALLAALGAAFPGCLAAAPAAPAPHAGMSPVERAERVILARLYAAHPRPVAWLALRTATEATGLPPDIADAAASALSARKTVAWKGETLVIAPD